MTTPASGLITMKSVKDEFNIADPVTMAKFYNLAPGVPASGKITLTDLYNKSAIKSYQWVRVEFADNGASGYANTAEIGITLNGALVAVNGYSASSEFPANPIAYAFDGNASTNWLAATVNTSAQILLAYSGVRNFNAVRIMPGLTYQNVGTIRVYGSNTSNSDGFVLIREFGGLAGPGWVQGQYRVFSL